MVSVLLTGGSGYLGSRVARTLDAAGIRYQTLARRLESIEAQSLAGYDFAIHCAGALRHCKDRLETAIVSGTRALVRGLKGPRRIVFVSSRSVYPATGPHLVDEEQPTLPWDIYGETKLRADAEVRESGKTFVVFRSSTLFGHPHRSRSFPDFVADRALTGEPVELAVPDRDIDYPDVDFLAELIVHAYSLLSPARHRSAAKDISRSFSRERRCNLCADAGRSASPESKLKRRGARQADFVTCSGIDPTSAW